jgi:uncharacterized protein (TIGR02246 family)
MSGPTETDARAQDDREIRAIVDRMFDAWGRGDAAAYHADLTDDADYVAFDGSRRNKADSIRSHQNLFRTVLYGSRLTGEVESIRFVTPDVAVVHLTGSVVEGCRGRPWWWCGATDAGRSPRSTTPGSGHSTPAALWSSWAAASSTGAPTGPGASSAEHGRRARRWSIPWWSGLQVRARSRAHSRPGTGDPRRAGFMASRMTVA